MNYYNEFDPFAAEWLTQLIKEGLIPNGKVDTRSIVDVQPSDLAGFAQCHFFAGIGGWSYALRIAGWPDNRSVWTGSCPCQPFSVAGKGKGTSDERHLWPEFHRLIRECKPAIVFGEQVASRAGREWFAGVRADLEDVGYGAAAADLCAAGVGAPHIRQRLYWVARSLGDADGSRADTYTAQGASRPPIGERGGGIDVGDAYRTERETRDVLTFGDATRPECFAQSGSRGDMADTDSELRDGCGNIGPRGRYEHPDRSRSGDMVDAASLGRREGRTEHELLGWGPAVTGAGSSDMADADDERPQGFRSNDYQAGRERPDIPEAGLCNGAGFWSDSEWRRGADGKERRVKPGVCLLANGVPNRVGRLRGYGNAIVPQVAAEVIKPFMGTGVY